MRLDDPGLVCAEYASEERLAARNRVFRDLREGEDAEEVAFCAVVEAAPEHVLEVGCGAGELAARLTADLPRVVALDISARMVELARARGVDARRGDVQALPFSDGEFDCVLAGWMLYHVPDLDRGLAEIVRALRPGGRLVATTYANDNFRELWEPLGDDAGNPRHAFREDTGDAALRRHFGSVVRRDVEAWTIFPDAAAARAFVAATISRAHLADRVPGLQAPLRTRNHQIVFVAEKT